MGSSFAQCNGNGNDRPIANVDIQETTSNILVLANSARLRPGKYDVATYVDQNACMFRMDRRRRP